MVIAPVEKVTLRELSAPRLRSPVVIEIAVGVKPPPPLPENGRILAEAPLSAENPNDEDEIIPLLNSVPLLTVMAIVAFEVSVTPVPTVVDAFVVVVVVSEPAVRVRVVGLVPELRKASA